MAGITQEKHVLSFTSIVVPEKNQNEKFKMSEILKQKLILIIMNAEGNLPPIIVRKYLDQ